LAGALIFTLALNALPLGETQNAMLAELTGAVQQSN
jgi:hypothetical protein